MNILQNNTLLLAQNMYLEIQELNPARFLTASRLGWQATLKRTKAKQDLLVDVDMVLTSKNTYNKNIICHAIYFMQKLITNT